MNLARHFGNVLVCVIILGLPLRNCVRISMKIMGPGENSKNVPGGACGVRGDNGDESGKCNTHSIFLGGLHQDFPSAVSSTLLMFADILQTNSTPPPPRLTILIILKLYTIKFSSSSASLHYVQWR